MTDLITSIILFEDGNLSDKDTLKLFSKLIKNGECWVLQGFYGRTATSLIDNELIDKKGKINWKKFNELESVI